ncbi:MAG TPA: dihydroneopterin aldolase [Candidatus Saccharimonadales bacterium]|nr:dihydroneopterin aldolase [Candidatus Saccharimonadales bacterium]
MPLTLFIKDLIVAGKHGVHDHEKENPQRFGVSVELDIADSSAVHSDDLTDTPDWSKLRDAIIAIVEDKTYDLVERLAMEIAAKMLEAEGVSRAVVTIDKIDAFESGTPGVRLEVVQTTS